MDHQAQWLDTQMVRWDGLAFEPAAARTAALVFRPDVYRSAIVGTSEPLPGASSSVEASLAEPTAVGMQQGTMMLEGNRFLNHRSINPADLAVCLAGLR